MVDGFFVRDSLCDGRSIRTFNVLDDYNREGLGIEVDFSLPSAGVIRSLDQIIEWRGKPSAIPCDNGPEKYQPSTRWMGEQTAHHIAIYTAWKAHSERLP